MKRKPKAMEITADPKKRALLVQGASETAVRQIAEIFSGQKQSAQGWKNFKNDVLKPSQASFDTIYLKKKDGSDFQFLCANPTKLWRSMEVSMNSALFGRKHQAKNYTSSFIMMRLQQEMFWLL